MKNYSFLLLFSALTLSVPLFALPQQNQQELEVMAKSFQEKGDLQRALTIWASLCKENPKNTQYLLEYAKLLAQDRRIDQAEMVAAQMLKISPCDKEAIALLRKIARSSSAPDRVLARVHACEKDSLQTVLEKGWIEARTGGWKRAEYLYDKAQDQNLSRAERAFRETLLQSNCNSNALKGLRLIAEKYQEKGASRSTLRLYRLRLKCDSSNCQDLSQTASLLSDIGRTREAVKVLESQPICNERQLGQYYLDLEEWNAAEKIFSHLPDSNLEMGKIYLAQREWIKAEACFRAASYNVGLGDVFMGQQLYTDAIPFYQAAGDDYANYRLFAAKQHVDPAIEFYGDVGQFNWGLPPQKGWGSVTEYDTQSLTLQFPLHDTLKFDLIGKNYLEKERDPKQHDQNDYRVNLVSMLGKVSYELVKDLNIAVTGGVKLGRQVEKSAYPFSHTSRVEPVLTALYNRGGNYLSLLAGYDSFIIVDLSKNKSELLQYKAVEGVYQYTFPLTIRPSLAFGIRQEFYNHKQDNVKTEKNVSLRTFIPGLGDYFSFGAEYDDADFTRLSPDYLTYKVRRMRSFSFAFHQLWRARTYFELSAEHGFTTYKDFSNRIGAVHFFSPEEKLHFTKYTLKGSYRFGTRLLFELASSYYTDTFPYCEKQLNLTLKFQF